MTIRSKGWSFGCELLQFFLQSPALLSNPEGAYGGPRTPRGSEHGGFRFLAGRGAGVALRKKWRRFAQKIVFGRPECPSKQSKPAAAQLAAAPRSWRIRARALYLAVHRWLGLILGVLFVLVGATGALLTFAPQIDAALYPDLLVSLPPAAGAPFAPLDEIYTAGVIDLPPQAQPSFMSMPRTEGGVATIFYRTRTDDGASATHRVYIDPYTTRVTGDRLVKTGDDEMRQSFFNSVRSLHYTLWQGSDRSFWSAAPPSPCWRR